MALAFRQGEIQWLGWNGTKTGAKEEWGISERTGRHYRNNQSLLPGLSVFIWSCCVCVELNGSLLSELLLPLPVCICHLLVIFCSPLPDWRAPLKPQTVESDLLWTATSTCRLRTENLLGGGARFELEERMTSRDWNLWVCFETFCVRIMYGYDLYYIQCSFCS